MIVDSLCPECHGPPELISVTPRKLVKRCRDCGHEWSEERPQELLDRKGWIRQEALR